MSTQVEELAVRVATIQTLVNVLNEEQDELSQEIQEAIAYVVENFSRNVNDLLSRIERLETAILTSKEQGAGK